MADFCKQCADKHFPPEYDKDLAFRYWKEFQGHDVEELVMSVICEGCGHTNVNSFGVCLGQCLEKHGA